MIQLTIKDLSIILNRGGASLDFKTGRDTKKRGFLVSIKDTETQFTNATKRDIKELVEDINKLLRESNTYNAELNKNNILGFWLDDNDTLFLDVSKCIRATKKDIYKVKNEAFINSQYSVYNNETNETYNLIIPIYTLYNTSDLLGRPSADNIANYSRDFYNLKDIADYLNIGAREGLSYLVFNSSDDIPEDYNYNKVIIKDTSNYTRDLLDNDINLSIDEAYHLSRLIKEEF